MTDTQTENRLSVPAPKKEYTFDMKLMATAYVEASTEAEARLKLADYADCLDISMTTPSGVTFNEAHHDNRFDLVEIDGEAV